MQGSFLPRSLGGGFFSCCMKVTGNSGQYVQIHRVRLEVSAHFVYNEL